MLGELHMMLCIELALTALEIILDVPACVSMEYIHSLN